MAVKLQRVIAKARNFIRKNCRLPSRKSPELLAGMATSVYLSIVIIAVCWRAPEFIKLPLNELGDFLAGVFGPLAVFWVVLGYYQQGKELKVSSKALIAQCVELANSAEQQRLALDVSRSQMVLAQEKHEIEMLELEESIRPRASLSFGGSGRTVSSDYHNFEVFIYNAPAYNLSVVWRDENVEFSAVTAGYVKAQSKLDFQVTFDRLQSPQDIDMSVFCNNVRERSYGYHFTFNVESRKIIAHSPSLTTIR